MYILMKSDGKDFNRFYNKSNPLTQLCFEFF